MDKPVLFLDVDGVLLDFVNPFMVWCAAKGYATPRWSTTPTDWFFHGHLKDPSEAGRIIEEFINSKFWDNLPPLVAPYLLQDLSCVYDLVVISNVPEVGRTYRTEYLTDMFDDVFESFNYVDSHMDKFYVMDELVQERENAGIVEDRPHTIEAAVNMGVPVYRVDTPYNKHVPGEMMSGTSAEIVQHLINRVGD